MWLSVIPHVFQNAKHYKYLINCGQRIKASSLNLVVSPVLSKISPSQEDGCVGSATEHMSLVVCQSFFYALDHIVALVFVTAAKLSETC